MSKKTAKHLIKVENNDAIATPVLKWAGGKSQLLPVLNANYPKELIKGKIDTYIEPFIGGGAVFFDIVNKFNIKSAYLFDINPELVILYNSIKINVRAVLTELDKLSKSYLDYDEEGRAALFYDIRNEYNSGALIAHQAADLELCNAKRSALTVFLNRTCFNGLFRVNSKGAFNVPHGRYSNPNIIFFDRLIAVSNTLQKATIKLTDFSSCEKYITGKTFIYYDPPYRPLSVTSLFNSYSKEGFKDDDQVRLAETYKKLSRKGVFQLLSNSDPTNYSNDLFFDELYKDFNILRVEAKRIINANGNKRGILREILVKNY
ncbi:MAG: Dam family site-specific DNA-(adenine-N6)-methyltransferase [Rickettsiales bacterium]